MAAITMPGVAEIAARYEATEMVVDKFGRMITVVRLRWSQTLAIRRMAETDDAVALAYMASAAAVRSIGETVIPFPKNLLYLNATIDMLDTEGMNAAMEAVTKLQGGIAEGGDDAEAPKL